MAPKLNDPEWVADDAVRYSDRDDLTDVLSNAVNRATQLAAQHGLVCPLAIVLTDAKARRLLTMTMDRDECGWVGSTAPGECDKPSAIAFPWFLLVEDADGKKLRVRVELGSAWLC